MDQVLIKPRVKSKRHLKGLWKYEFPSLIYLIFELFETYTDGRKEIFEIQLLLDEIGYRNLKDIPADEVESIRALIKEKLPEWKMFDDPEFVTYQLMAAIRNKDILVIVDDTVIDDIHQPFPIHSNSIITFFNNQLLNQITFTTL
ncbi:hypothetical protein [Emticicia agri]|uniref:Uncharacterized protein n=1 Tax=Emticicia agri TaxID=2492393 RepID=A0A4Q5LVE6_9BACT|nr:hypothetical protein [Emticicia agri]RYU93477.1 hypothetical protein EWM59_21890 [Emticicia agri]